MSSGINVITAGVAGVGGERGGNLHRDNAPFSGSECIEIHLPVSTKIYK